VPPSGGCESTVLMVQALARINDNNGPQHFEKDTRMFFSMKEQH
jgi:hypothetical protein